MTGLPKLLEDLPPLDEAPVDGEAVPRSLDELQGRLGYRFARPQLLRVAVTVASWTNEHPTVGWPSNAVLEFFGDAVLDLLAADRIWQRFPDLAEGELTRLRARLVAEQALVEAAGAIGLGEFFWLGRGDCKLGARGRRGVLADGVEAILGAVFLDARARGDDPLAAAGAVFEALLGTHLAGLDPSRATDPKSRLQHWAQATHRITPGYVGEPGAAGASRWRSRVELQFPDGRTEVLGTGEGASLREAERRAAQAALTRLESTDATGSPAVASAQDGPTVGQADEAND